MPRAPLLMLVSLVTGCSSELVKQIDFSFGSISGGYEVSGTAANDLWAFAYDGKDAQDDSFDLHVRYWDGSTDREVPVSKELFRDGACGKAGAIAAVSRGEVWLASHYAPGCGLAGNAKDRLIFGKLKSDGTWEDHSSDFPVSAPGTYTTIKLAGRGGVLYATVQYGPNSPSFKTFRYGPDGNHGEFAGPSGTLSDLNVLGPDDLITGEAPEVHRYVNGEWKQFNAPFALNLGHAYVRGNGEGWSFMRSFTAGQTQAVYRDDGVSFTEVELTPKEGEELRGSPVGVIARGKGKFTWLLASGPNSGAKFALYTREYDGSTLGPQVEVSAQQKCVGTPDECLPGTPTLSAVLEDGNFLVLTARWTSVVLADQL